jgi:hypothetical protein
MLKRLLIVLSVWTVLGVGEARAAVIGFSATLGPEVLGATGTGSALVTFDTAAHTLVVYASFSGLSGETTVAHIHCCVDSPGTASVATYPGTFPGFPVGVTSGTYTSPAPIDLTQTASYSSAFLTAAGGTAAAAEALLLQNLMLGRAYLNIHTSTFPGGEIRGFLTPVPEPFTLTLLTMGVGVLAVRRRTRSARES